ncbi:hypothetical protein [Gottfriedia acidiceleris]|uniref:Uncharacterized protein n=1 Tax=Gottfriedia acidiceleris TaxID=371036 RepID=A0ABY4JIX1_9BACI|nr:hypothetical protein [Gottfriedia acidiceleris]UPM53790.1 hypothetical protein MY490_18735 [Gottfriedia acidiceleris]
MKLKKKVLSGILASATLFGLSYNAMAATTSGTSTAQSIMADLHTEGTFALVENQFYHYNTAVAASYFTNAWDGNAPKATVSGAGASYVTTIPDGTAYAPAPSQKELDSVIANNDNQHAFLEGKTLTGSTYTQNYKLDGSVKVTDPKTGKESTKSVTYTYTYTYNVAPTTPGDVTPFTAWDLTKTTGDSTAHISITADIAGESVQLSKQNPTGKYSFSIGDDALTNRVTGLSITVTDNTDVINPVVVSTTATDSTIVKGQDFNYFANAGTYGNSTAAISALKEGSAANILNGDTFKGNDNGGADGSALSKAAMTPVDVELGAGDYSITLSGSVKGNGIDLNPQAFEITKKIHIITPMGQN